MYDLYDMYDMYDMYDLAHVSGWERHNLHDLRRVYWVASVLGSVLYRSCKSSGNGSVII